MSDCDVNSTLPVEKITRSCDCAQSTELSKKKVTFHETVLVMLIPSIQEYKDDQLYDHLWWGVDDFRTFQMDMSAAFKKFMRRSTCTDLKEALRLFILDELLDLPVDGFRPVGGFKRPITSMNLIETSSLVKRVKA